jgi:glycosyltransferase involved in cell wall biosynthesis
MIDIVVLTHRYPNAVDGGGVVSTRLLVEQLSLRPEISSAKVVSFDGDDFEQTNNYPVYRLSNVDTQSKFLENILAGKDIAFNSELITATDIVHTYNMNLVPLAGIIGNVFDVSTIATLNSYMYLPKRSYLPDVSIPMQIYDKFITQSDSGLFRYFMKKTDHFICLSNASKQVFTQAGFDPKDISVIPNMIDPNFEPPPVDLRKSDPVITYVGRLSKAKGVKFLIDAAEQIESFKEIRIVGAGPAEEHLKTLAADSQRSDKISFIGKVPYSKVHSEYREADIFVHPGVWPEPFGRTILEAMQSALPIVATNIGGPKEIIPNSEHLCDPGNSEALANTINNVTPKIKQIGLANREYVYQYYNKNEINNRTVDIYQRLHL